MKRQRLGVPSPEVLGYMAELALCAHAILHKNHLEEELSARELTMARERFDDLIHRDDISQFMREYRP